MSCFDRQEAQKREQALALAANAIQEECNVLYTEDMQNGRQVEGVSIVNPFVG